MTAQFRGVVMSSFVDHCHDKSVNVDPEVIDMLVRSFMGDDVDFAKISESSKSSFPEKKKKSTAVPCEFTRMPQVNHGKCMSRTHAKGYGFQCSRSHADGEEYCKTHLKSLNAECIPVWGRIDKPRCRKRADNGGDCCWKEFCGDGDIEDVSQESVGVGVCPPSPVASESSVSSDSTEQMPDMDTIEPNTLEKSTIQPVEEQVVVEEAPKDDEQVVEEVVEEASKDDEQVVEQVVEEAPKDDEQVVEEVVEDASKDDEQVVEEVVEEAPKDDEQVVEEVVEEAPKDEDIDESPQVAIKYPRMGKYQGVQYRFSREEGEDNIVIQKVDPCSSPMIMNVGYYDESDGQVLFKEEYQDVHDLEMVNDDQDEVEWE